MSKLKDSIRATIRENELREREFQEKGIARTFEAIISKIVPGYPVDLPYVIDQFNKKGITLSKFDIEWVKSELLALTPSYPKSILDTIDIIEDTELIESPCESFPAAETQELIGEYEALSAFTCQDIDFNELADSADVIDSKLKSNSEQIFKDFLDSIEKMWD